MNMGFLVVSALLVRLCRPTAEIEVMDVVDRAAINEYSAEPNGENLLTELKLKETLSRH